MQKHFNIIISATLMILTSACVPKESDDLVINEYHIQVEGMDWSGINTTIASDDNIDPDTNYWFSFYVGTMDGRDRQSIGLVNPPIQSGSYLLYYWGNGESLPFITLTTQDAGEVTPTDIYVSKLDSVSYIEVIDFIESEKRFKVGFDAKLHRENQNREPYNRFYGDSIQVSGYIDFSY